MFIRIRVNKFKTSSNIIKCIYINKWYAGGYASDINKFTSMLLTSLCNIARNRKMLSELSACTDTGVCVRVCVAMATLTMLCACAEQFDDVAV